MKKLLILFFILMLTLTFVSCATNKNNEIYINPDFNELTMKSINGKQINVAKAIKEALFITDDEIAIALAIPNSWLEFKENLYFQKTENALVAYTLSDEFNSEEVSDYEPYYADLFSVMYEDNAVADSYISLYSKYYEENEFLGSFDNKSCYLFYNKKLDVQLSNKFTDKEISDINDFLKKIKDIKDNIILFENETVSLENIYFGDFTAKDMNGNEVTQNIFEDYELTMINIWATWCNPCVSEMPALSELYDELPDNVNMITICDDAEFEYSLAKLILEDCNAKFTTVIKNDMFNERTVISKLRALPTTVFVDSQGKLVGGMIEGARTKEAYFNFINERLGALNE